MLCNLGSSTSLVKPGNVVLSSTTSCWGRIRSIIRSAAFRMNELSGSLVLLSGVGTQMMMASARPSTSGSVEADSFFSVTSGSTTEVGTSSM